MKKSNIIRVMMIRIMAADFNLAATLESGQVFGFSKNETGEFSGRFGNHDLSLRQAGSFIEVISDAKHDLCNEIRSYFDLERDLSPVYDILNQEKIDFVLNQFRGLRLIRQNSWEALACFIISSNNNVKRIQGIWQNLSRRLSEDGKSFPAPERIAKSHERILRELGLGYRAPFLHRTAQFISVNPVCLDEIRCASYEEAKYKLIQFPGIGEKVADCALLYGFQKYEAFPVDVWILRIMRKLYFKNRKISEDRIRQYGQKKWREHAGYIQQYLFHAARMGILN